MREKHGKLKFYLKKTGKEYGKSHEGNYEYRE